MGEAITTCRICEKEVSFREGWELFEFGNPVEKGDRRDCNICPDCLKVIRQN